jgi:hypothetical protein
MSAKVRLAGALPGDEEINGLDSWAERMVERPERVILALVWLDVRKIEDITDTGERTPVARVRRIEPISEAKKAPQELRDMALRLHEERTGKTPLPIESLGGSGPVVGAVD